MFVTFGIDEVSALTNSKMEMLHKMGRNINTQFADEKNKSEKK